MGDRFRPLSIEELPSHLILEILCLGRLSAVDLVCLELTSKTFGGNHGWYPYKLWSLVDFAAYQLAASHLIYSRMSLNSQRELYDRCGGNWKRALRFLQSLEQSSGMAETSADASYDWEVSHLFDQQFFCLLLWFWIMWCTWSWS